MAHSSDKDQDILVSVGNVGKVRLPWLHVTRQLLTRSQGNDGDVDSHQATVEHAAKFVKYLSFGHGRHSDHPSQTAQCYG